MPKKLIFLLIPTFLILIIFSCGNKNPAAPDNPTVSDLRLGLNQNYADSVKVSAMVSDPQGLEDVDSVWVTYKYLRNDANRIVGLHDDGLNGDSAAADGRYSATFADPSGHFELGYYPIRCYAMDKTGNLSNRLEGVFWAVDGNAPLLCDPDGPDSLNKRISEIGFVTVVAHDSNGLSDIDSVYAIVTKPNGSEGAHIRLFDDGTMGDAHAGDGIFTSGLHPDTSTASGNFLFTFYAIDRENIESNNPTLTIKIY